MAITRTGMIDDDGSGSTGTIFNNAWKQELYNQIDAVTVPLTQVVTLFDASGGGLTLNTPNCVMSKIGRLVYLWLQIIYPATANAQYASIGGLPFVVRVPVGVAQGYGPARIWFAPQNQQVLQPLTPATGVNAYNSEMSGTNNIVSLIYLTD